MAKTVGTEKELKESPTKHKVTRFLDANPHFENHINSLSTIKEKLNWIDGYNKSLADKKWYRERQGMATEGGLPPSSERLFNKGGLPKKPKFMKGGSYKGKSHMYAAGGMVKELKI